MRKGLLITLLIALSLLAVPRVLAHGYIVRAIPEDRAVMERAPTRLQYWFSEALEVEFSTLNVRDQDGEIVAVGGVAETDTALMMVRLPDDLPEGAYVVELRPAFASDGHVVAESRVFFVGESVGGVSGQAASDQANALEIVWKALHYMAAMALFGAFTLYGMVLVPAWGSQRHPAGLLPPRVMGRLWWIIGTALAVMFAANMLGMIQQTMVFFNIGFTQALDMDFINLVRIGSRFGDIWNWRMILLGLVAVMFAVSLYLRRDQPEVIRPTLVVSAWVMALVLGSSSVLSHAAGGLMLPWVGVMVDWLHILAVGFWAGGLLVLVLVLPVALQPYQDDERRQALLAVMSRFSRLATTALVIVIVTGIYSASNWITKTGEFQSAFGIVLLVKVAMVTGLVAVGTLHHIALRPERYVRFQQVAGRFGGFGNSLRLESLLVLLVLAGAAWLSATPIPTPDFAQTETASLRTTQTINQWQVSIAVSPGGPGINSLDVQVADENGPVDGLVILLQAVFPERDRRGPQHQLEEVEPGLYVTTIDDIDRAGTWWNLLDLSQSDEAVQRVAVAWNINEGAAVIESVDPSTVQLLTLIGVIVGLAVSVYPLARRGAVHLRLDPATVATAASASIITIGALLLGYHILQQTRQTYDAALEPVPEVVNPVLPDQASLDRGRALFDSQCSDWLNERADMAALIDRMPRTRDSELYGAVRVGWRDLPPCGDGLSDAAVWDIVNAIRPLQMRDLD